MTVVKWMRALASPYSNLIYFRFDELEVGALAPIRLNFLGSRVVLEKCTRNKEV
jgi:hypothetical protein